jgi:16S rRNA (uracil1498-N3)-methyltransferase
MIRLFLEEPFDRGLVVLTGDPAQHARVRRVQADDAIALLDGRGRVGIGVVEGLDRTRLQVIVRDIESVPAPTRLEVVVPVADRDRMLFAAEKCVELQITSWRPVYFARSRSVSRRGEGPKFQDKVRARMQSALEQCGGAWLPELSDEVEFAETVGQVTPDLRHYVLDQRGAPILRVTPADAAERGVAIACGPEGGLEPPELHKAIQAGWTPLALAGTTLRFETALISAVAVVRALQVARSAD